MQPTDTPAQLRGVSPPVIIDLTKPSATNEEKTLSASSSPTTAAATAARIPEQPQVIRQRRSGYNVSQKVVEIHYHHHHMHALPPEACGSTNAVAGAPFRWKSDADVQPLPVGASSGGGNPVSQMSFQQPTLQNNFTWILGCLVCCPTTFVCVMIWLAIAGVIAWDEFFRSPWG